jgi:hypothetical protein
MILGVIKKQGLRKVTNAQMPGSTPPVARRRNEAAARGNTDRAMLRSFRRYLEAQTSNKSLF